MSAQNTAAAVPTTGVVPAAADEVSALTAAQFAAHAQMYQAVSAQAAAIHEMSVNTLATSARFVRGHRGRQRDRGRLSFRRLRMLDFAALPPEINSGRMYAGPGSGPMLTAAVAWDELAAELYLTASSYNW